ncbi:GlxA family transcriptional regulator [Gallaecimonas mangrovi]|uniref:GlxA family transcriptional regulator n=1 Tax=Gallaecimonas mangrovi TaxID=2291597 RepID=UPI000E201441|nr:GlxA family transcriptional regulator [Gallaecimonas mangrovi]
MKTVAFLIFSDVMMLDFSGPAEVFAVANRYLPEQEQYLIQTIGAEDGLITASNGVAIQPQLTLAQAQHAFDLLLFPGGPGAYDFGHPQWVPWVKSATAKAGQFASICTGAFLLAEAGLLKGRRVTTHWRYLERLAKRCPEALIENNQLIVQDHKFLSCGGITAGIDLALFIVEQHHGHELALKVAKVLLVVMKRQGGQAQFSPLLAEISNEDNPISQVQRYVVDHLHDDFSVEKMAAMAAMSQRHFSRNFQRQAAMTPMEFVRAARVDEARVLLETSQLPLKTIAFECGFSGPRQLRQHFLECLGITPAQYRSRFG